MLGNCNGFAKLINGTIYTGHSTHNHYTFLLRIYKSFNFPTRNSQVGAQTLTFSSRPGDLISKDDFYVLDSGLKVMESSL
jgi:glycosylphosphatidylinositol transamidase (GPIT) subunit GPI8